MFRKSKNHTSTSIKWMIYLLVGVFFSCANDAKEIAKFEDDQLFPTQSAKEVEVFYSTEGNVVFQLNAPVLNVYNGEREFKEMPEGVVVQIFDSVGNVTTKLTSNYAIDSSYVNKMEAKNDVVVVNDKGEKLNTEHLVWDKNTKKITSDVFVKITTKDQVLMGEGLIANQDFSNYRILKPRGTINIDND